MLQPRGWREKARSPRKRRALLGSGLAKVVLVLFATALLALEQPWSRRAGRTSSSANVGGLVLPGKAEGQSLQQRRPRRWLREGQGRRGPSRRWLSFVVCNGLSNQRIAILSAALLAQESGRTLLLPRLVLNGTQVGPAQVNEHNSPSCEFGDVMDPQLFRNTLAAAGIEVEMPSFSTPAPFYLDLSRGSPLRLLEEANPQEHVALSCPLLRIPPQLFVRHTDLAWAGLAGMRASEAIMGLADIVEGRIKEGAYHSQQQSHGFNMLHLRLERDWLAHCAIMEQRYQLPCLNNTGAVGVRLRELGVAADLPLLLVLEKDALVPDLYDRALASLRAEGYQPLLLWELLDDQGRLSREQAAMLSYELGLRAHQFVGNAVSTFSALLILERAHAGLFAAHYNGGKIPLESFIPLFEGAQEDTSI